MKILCTGDVHIGRRSSRIPPHLDAPAHSSAGAWRRIVDLAIANRVDVVAIAGDLIDHSNRYFEAVGAVASGLRRLADAGIATVLVAGNHDWDVLPSIVDSLDAGAVHLLGRGGRWERLTLTIAGSPLHLDGWSYPGPHVPDSPVSSYAPSHDHAPTLALLHADLEQIGSRYAPVLLAELRRHARTFFLLGHVHTPRLLEEPGGARLLYPGSPQALDPGEPGVHGVHLLEIGPGGWRFEARSLSSTRYEPLAIDVEGVEAVVDVEPRIYAELRRSLAAVSEESTGVSCVRYRLRLTGRSAIQREIERRLHEFAGDLEVQHGTLSGTIESWSVETRPIHDLEALAGGIGAPAVLASLLREGAGGGAATARLRAELRRVVAEVHDSRSFVEIAGGPEEVEALERVADLELDRAAHLLLDELMLQKEAHG